MQPHQSIALRLAIDMKLFDAAATLSANKSEMQTADLATQTGADPLLVGKNKHTHYRGKTLIF